MEVIYQALADMVTSGAGLLLVGGAYLLWWLSGFVPNLFSPKQWSWKRGLQDFCKVLLMAVILIAGAGLADVGSAFFAMKGWDITEGVEAFSTFALIGAMSLGFVYYLGKAINNAANFFKLKWNEVKGNREQFDNSQKELAGDIKEFIETITTKTDKEHIQEAMENGEGVSATLFEDVEVNLADAGKGGVNNTYPEPYRSAAQDSMTDPSTCYNRECVSYCAWKIKELTGNWPKRTGGMNARDWVARLRENGYGTVVSKPQDGGYYVGVSTAGQYGHVVWFEGGQTISEYNYLTRGGFSVRVINLSAYQWVQIKAPAKPAPAVVAPAVPDNTPTKKNPTIKYTYKAGDTFGQVLLDLGLSTSATLWGDNGEIVYYTNQLHDQGIWGNIPIGTTITLTPRK